jgi:hypothetical protein
MRWVIGLLLGASVLQLMSACGLVSRASCEYDGKTYEDGASFLDSEGCNTCECADGKVACTGKACFDGCYYAGNVHAPGESFLADDGCNTCTCAEDGNVECTLLGCNTCDDIGGEDYAAAIQQAKTCDPAQPDPCSKSIVLGLACGCDTFVNPEQTAALDIIENTQRRYSSAGCAEGIACGACAVPARGSCSPKGQCFDEYAPDEEGRGCRAGGVVYPHGASDIQDPFSCNQCQCDDGQLICTEIACEMPCPPNAKPGTSCAECAPNDACLVVEHGCLLLCGGDGECQRGACVEGVCANYCG